MADDVAELCLGGIDKLTDKYFDYVYDSVDGWRKRRKGEAPQSKQQRYHNYMEHQNNQNGNVNGNDHKHDDYDLDQQRYRGRDEQNTRNYQNPQQEYSQFQRQDRQRDFSQSQRANQRYVNGVTVIDKRIPPPPPPPLYLNYRTANAQPRSRRSDDNIAYYYQSPPKNAVALYPAVAAQGAVYQPYPQELDPRYQQSQNEAEDTPRQSSHSEHHSTKSKKHKDKDKDTHSSLVADIAGGIVGAYVGKKLAGGDKLGSAAGAAVGALGAGAISEKYKERKR